tara:strand:+ start:1498 stop:1986 length:489 start_codon:yes stop_codon:yes gene_type:complete
MAGTITKAQLDVSITETVTLNGVTYGNNLNKSFAGNGKVDQRIMTIAAKGEEGMTVTTILALSTVDAKGQVVVADYSYFRITNTDDSNALILELYNGADYIYFNVEAGESFILMSPETDYLAASGPVTFADIQQINGASASTTESIDIEYVAVTKGGIEEGE